MPANLSDAPPLVHVTTVHPRHDVRIFHKEAQSLRVLGRSVVLVVADGLGDETHRDGVRFVDVGRPDGRLSRALGGSARAFGAVRALKPAIVHFHDPELIPMGLALKALGHKVIYDVHEDVPEQILNKHWIARPLRRAVATGVSAIERVAKWFLDAFVTATPHIATKFPSARTVLVQNYPIKSELIAPDAVAYAERPPHFAYVGGMTEQRGGRQMVEAMGNLATEMPDARLAWAGVFMPSSLEATLRGLPGWKQVDYLGHLDRRAVAALLGGSRAGVVLFQPAPNHLEAQPNKLFEYMAAELPVIASDFPLWRRIVENAKCGILADPENPRAIAETMKWILAHPAEAEAMGRRGQEAVAHIYNWESEAKKLTDLYERLLSEPGKLPD